MNYQPFLDMHVLLSYETISALAAFGYFVLFFFASIGVVAFFDVLFKLSKSIKK